MNEHPDAIINLVDGTNLERNLYLTTQILELGIPVVIALNMIDLVKKNGDTIDTQKLGAALGCEVVETSRPARAPAPWRRQSAAIALAQARKRPPSRSTNSAKPWRKRLPHIAKAIAWHWSPRRMTRWYAVKLFERDEKVLESCQLQPPD